MKRRAALLAIPVFFLTPLGLSAQEQADEALRKKLGQPIKFEISSDTLETALKFLSERYDFQFEVNEEAFKKIGIKNVRQELVQLGVVRASLGRVLQLLRDQVKGTYEVKKGGKLVVVPANRPERKAKE